VFSPASVLRHSLFDLGGLIFPPECAVCETQVPFESRLCAACKNQIISNEYRCKRCAMPLPSVLPNEDCIHCRKADWKFSRVVALGSYRGKLKELVILCKKLRTESLRHALAILMAEQIRIALPTLDQHSPLLIPVPNHWTRVFSRAAPTADRLADLLHRFTGWPLASGMIRRVRKTRKQGMLSINERKQNVRGAFLKKGSLSLSGRHVVLIDDVLTSGATANEMARQLRRLKPSDVSVLVIARAIGH
jgi:ComF family protein